MNKLKSFTITELIVVMVVSSIILLLVLWFFERSTESYHNINSELENSNKIYSFLSRMKREIDHSDYITYNRDELDLYINDSIFSTYLFDNKNLIKNYSGIADTFPWPVGKVDTTSIYSPITGEFTKSISFTIAENFNATNVTFIKEYFSQFLYKIESKQK